VGTKVLQVDRGHGVEGVRLSSSIHLQILLMGVAEWFSLNRGSLIGVRVYLFLHRFLFPKQSLLYEVLMV
jgi:hypothetical protein